MWQTYYLRFDEPVELPKADGVTLVLDVVGTIYDADGNATPGWHVNARAKGELPADLVTHVLPTPQYPKRVFA